MFDRLKPLALHPLLLAAALTFANAAKPVLIDDTAYLLFARHLAGHPAEPYGFLLFWYDYPHPAIKHVLPPVLPYWLGCGIALFGEDLFALKLWLFPFAATLAYSARFLARRFAPGSAGAVAAMLTVGPGALPFFNFMLDLPALALQLAAIALALRGRDARVRWPWAIAAGLVTTLALQTKFSVLGLPAILLALGYFHGRIRFAALAVGVGLAGFAAWEGYVGSIHGISHFLHHTFGYAKDTNAQTKIALAVAMLGHVGLTAGWAGRAFVVPASAIGIGLVFLVLAVAPVPGANTILGIAFVLLGGGAVLPAVRTAIRDGSDRAANPEARFLAAWFVLELLVYFAVSPFPAGRRVLGLTVPLVLLLARSSGLTSRGVVFGLMFGVAATALDGYDAAAERSIPRRAAAITRGTGTTHTLGHWGFQYYAEREGMKLVDSRSALFAPGDWLLIPVGERPQTGGYRVEPNPMAMERVAELVEEDAIRVKTIPNLYAARTPFAVRTGPRLKYELYRVTDWTEAKIVRVP
jgi:4-amino-4-deoxy-L-arabinose transferase-like glycosyltransferase